jgi:hypothetical protein
MWSERFMTQQQLDRLVADATGEDIRSIRRRGFSIANPVEVNFDPEPDQRPPQWVDWDQLDRERAERLNAR